MFDADEGLKMMGPFDNDRDRTELFRARNTIYVPPPYVAEGPDATRSLLTIKWIRIERSKVRRMSLFTKLAENCLYSIRTRWRINTTLRHAHCTSCRPYATRTSLGHGIRRHRECARRIQQHNFNSSGVRKCSRLASCTRSITMTSYRRNQR